MSSRPAQGKVVKKRAWRAKRRTLRLAGQCIARSCDISSSPSAAEEKQNEMTFRNAANAFASDSCLATGPTYGKFVNGVVPASDQSSTPQRPSANTLHQQTIGVTSKRPPMWNSCSSGCELCTTCSCSGWLAAKKESSWETSW